MGSFLILCLSLVLCYDPVHSECPHSDPGCHPLCIEYVRECKYCRCNGGISGLDISGSRSASGDKWNSKFEGNKNSWGRQYTDVSAKEQQRVTGNTKVIIVHEKEADHKMAIPGLQMGGQAPFGMPHGPMTMQNPFQHLSPIRTGVKTLNVPLKSPGIPKYCVSIDKMEFESCGCTVVDEDGCLTCPCYSASRFWIAVKQKNTSNKPKPEKKECIGTMLCMLTCKSGYQLGKTGPDGCQACTCLKHDEIEKPEPEKSKETCLKLYECILKCSNNNQGFTVGEETPDGCRSCHCSNGGKNFGGSGGMDNGTGSMMNMFSNSGNGNNFLKSPTKGVGSSNESKAKCNPPMVMCTNDGNNLMQSMPGGSGASGGSSSSGGSKEGTPFSPNGGGSGSGSGMKSPFSSTLGGSGSGMGMKSPFGGGGPGMGVGGSGMGAMGPHGPKSPGFPSQKKVEETAYNENCFGPSCSAKDGGMLEGDLGLELMMGEFRK